jgi:hypothetical protein
MPQLANLVLTDRAATPVAHTFKPENISGGVGSLAESSGVPIGNNRVTISLTRTKDTGRYKPVLRMTFPVVQNETINGVTRPTVVRTAYADVSFSFDPSSTTQERKDVVGMVQTALLPAATVVNSVIVDLEGIY